MIKAVDLKPHWSPKSLVQLTGTLNVLSGALKNMGYDLNDKETYQKITLEQIIESISTKSYNTKRSYIDAYKMLFVHFNGSPSTLKELHDYTSQTFSTRMSNVMPISDDDYPEKIKKTLEETEDLNMYILGILTLDEKLSGIRVSDLISTRLVYDGVHSWIDLENNTWHIQSDFTKNKIGRSYPISESVSKILKPVEVRGWLLCKADGSPYPDASQVLKQFRKTYGYPYGRIRKTAVQKVHENNDLEQSKEKANILGHRLETALTSYVVKPKVKPIVKKRQLT